MHKKKKNSKKTGNLKKNSQKIKIDKKNKLPKKKLDLVKIKWPLIAELSILGFCGIIYASAYFIEGYALIIAVLTPIAILASLCFFSFLSLILAIIKFKESTVFYFLLNLIFLISSYYFYEKHFSDFSFN